MDDLVLNEADLPVILRDWLAAAPDQAFVIAVERMENGKLLLRPLPEASPLLVAQLRITMAKYRETLMNLT